jgi:uroporphyrinogen III methyltransferase/synthase
MTGGLLSGKQILVLRSRTQAGALVGAIEAAGGRAFAFPVIRIADPEDWGPLDEAIGRLERYRWLVITSPNGAERFVARLHTLGGDAARLPRVAAVGSATAATLAHLGVRVDLVPPEFKGKALPGALEPHLRPGDRVLLARGDLADKALVGGLEALGAVVDDLIAYRTLPTDEDPAELKRLLAEGAIHYAAFTSGSTVRNLLTVLGGPAALAGVRIACIGPETEAVARRLGLPIHCTAKVYTVDGLIEAIVDDKEVADA